MKKTLVILLFISIALAEVNAQGVTPAVIQSTQPFPTVPKITVVGSASKSVAPDRFYFKIILTEDREGRKKTNIDSLESKLRRVLTSFSIPKENLKLQNTSQRIIDKKRSTEVEVTKHFSLLVTSEVNLRLLLVALTKNDFHNVSISHIDHSQKAEFMEEVRREAMKNAKQKANLLLGAIDEGTGALLDVSEYGHTDLRFTNYTHVNQMYNSYISSGKFWHNDFNYDKLKLEAGYQLVFEIKNTH